MAITLLAEKYKYKVIRINAISEKAVYLYNIERNCQMMHIDFERVNLTVSTVLVKHPRENKLKRRYKIDIGKLDLILKNPRTHIKPLIKKR